MGLQLAQHATTDIFLIDWEVAKLGAQRSENKDESVGMKITKNLNSH